MVHLTRDSRITFGIHIGTKLKDLPPGYLLYLYKQNVLFGDYRKYVEDNKANLEEEKKQAMKNRSR
jgi:hypothetical protein